MIKIGRLISYIMLVFIIFIMSKDTLVQTILDEISHYDKQQQQLNREKKLLRRFFRLNKEYPLTQEILEQDAAKFLDPERFKKYFDSLTAYAEAQTDAILRLRATVEDTEEKIKRDKEDKARLEDLRNEQEVFWMEQFAWTQSKNEEKIALNERKIAIEKEIEISRKKLAALAFEREQIQRRKITIIETFV